MLRKTWQLAHSLVVRLISLSGPFVEYIPMTGLAPVIGV